MRTFLIFLVIILWFILGFFYWKSAEKCCVTGDDDTSEVIPPVVKEKDCPLCFNWSNASPVLGKTWASKRDSIRGLKKDNNLLQITGLYRTDETNSTGYDNLGLARADSVRLRWFSDWPEDDVKLNARQVGSKAAEKTNIFESANFRYLINSQNIQEVDDKTIIRFPFNSTRKLDAKDVEDYLDKVAARVIKSKEKVSLTGHTDSYGDDQSNQRLGMARANIIRDYLRAKGVPVAQIMTNSRGESQPIATNDTDQGRAQNRRTELQIIK